MDLLSLLSGLVRGAPDALLAIDATPQGPLRVSRAEFWRRTLALRSDLERAGVGPGDRVAVWVPNWSDALAWQFATSSVGGQVIGVNTRYNVDEVVHVLDRARPKTIALAHGFHGLDLAGRLQKAADRSAAERPSVAVVAGPNGRVPAGLSNYDIGGGVWVPSAAEAPREGPAGTSGAGPDGSGADAFAVPAREGDGDPLAVAFTTSGSTGTPKLAAHRESAVVDHAHADARGIGIGEGDVVTCVLPLSGVFGFSTAMAAIAAGAACLLEPVFQEDAVLADMARHRATHLVGGDDMVVRLHAAWQRGPRDLSHWRWLGIADFMGRSHDLAAWALAEFGTVTTGVYGSSEVFALATLWPDDEPAPRRWTGGGHPVSPDIEARAVNPVTGDQIPYGEQGELQLRGPNVVDDYLGDPDAADRAFTADGWFRTGDLVTIDEDGAIEYRCRMGDALRLRGFLVDPAEIEQRLAAHPGVRIAKVVGVRGEDGADRAVGFVVPETPDGAADRAGGADPETLRAWCAEGLAAFKVPARIQLLDRMPTTPGTNGTKIRTADLRELALRGLNLHGARDAAADADELTEGRP